MYACVLCVRTLNVCEACRAYMCMHAYESVSMRVCVCVCVCMCKKR